LKIYRRSLGMRALSLGCLLLFALLEFAHLSAGGGLLSFGGLLLAGLSLLSLAATLLNLGDRYAIDERGIRYENPLLASFGLTLDRSVPFSEIVSVRAYRGLRFGIREEHPSALFLEVARGRRFVIDSVEGFDELHRLIVSRVKTGESSGTFMAALPE
jgi:hypothetical protein